MRFFKSDIFYAGLASALALSGCNAKAGDSNAETTPVAVQYSEAGLRLVQLTITSPTSTAKQHEFTVEVARTREEQSKGMMFRTELAPDKGMLFPFARDRNASFWMKNTVIPLDIIFIRRDGTIESIAANTVPYSLDPVESGEPVGAVLELAGGRAKELSISAGDKVRLHQ